MSFKDIDLPETGESGRWFPDMELGGEDGKERWCARCGSKIQPARVTAGYAGSGRTVYGGYYGVPGRSGVYCRSCAIYLRDHSHQEAES